MTPALIPYASFIQFSSEEMQQRSDEFLKEMLRRRSIRHFSNRPVPLSIIQNCLQTACSAPSGANLQPWHFVAVQDAALKQRIRQAAEEEEHEFYTSRATPEWLEALAPLGTDERKPFLETAPWLIAIFVQAYGVLKDGRKVKHYYAHESTGIAAGFLIAAIHHAGLACLTHTPSPMGFLNQILERPANEKPFLLLVVGYPEENAHIPDLHKKTPAEMISYR
jgi:nitroreductase